MILPKNNPLYTHELSLIFDKVIELVGHGVVEANVILAVQELEAEGGLRDDVDVYFRTDRDFDYAVDELKDTCKYMSDVSGNHVSFYFEEDNEETGEVDSFLIKLKYLRIDGDDMMDVLVYNPAYDSIIDCNSIYTMESGEEDE